MSSPVIQALRSKTVPTPGRLAAAKAMLPLPPEELLEALVLLSQDEDGEVRAAAAKSLAEFDPERMRGVVSQSSVAAEVLDFLCRWRRGKREIYEALILNAATPDAGLAEFARTSTDASLLELIAINQERMIRHPALIESLLSNQASPAEAVRRAREVRTEFFEKELGVKRIADERRARAVAASAALDLEQVDEAVVDLIDEDLQAEDLRLNLAHLEAQQLRLGPEFIQTIQQGVTQAVEQEQQLKLTQAASDALSSLISDEAANQEVSRISEEMLTSGEPVTLQRLTMMQFIARLGIKQRVQLALKGNREARNILKRDSNKLVILGVLGNPRITEPEVEAISTMKSLPEDALRVIGLNRQWIRSYPLVHNLVRNPRTPVATSLPLLPRLFPKDLKSLTGNRNVPDVIRKSAQRLVAARST